jgi:hypothetical protein
MVDTFVRYYNLICQGYFRVPMAENVRREIADYLRTYHPEVVVSANAAYQREKGPQP